MDKVEFSVSPNQIIINPSIRSTSPTGQIEFWTSDTSHTYSVVIDNYDHFFDTPFSPLIFNITSKTPVTLKLGSRPLANDTKDYIVGVINSTNPVPQPPAAPPRIVITRPIPIPAPIP